MAADGLGIIETADEINRLAAGVENSGGVMLVPAFTGWGTPHWDPGARELLIGLTRDGRAQIARATSTASPSRWLAWCSWQRVHRAQPGRAGCRRWAAASTPCCKHRPTAQVCACDVSPPGKHRAGGGVAGRRASRVISDLRDLVWRASSGQNFTPRWKQRATNLISAGTMLLKVFAGMDDTCCDLLIIGGGASGASLRNRSPRPAGCSARSQ